MPEYVISVDEADEPTGPIEKLRAHRDAVLHRAFSILIVDPAGRMLMQQRAARKYHSPLLWTNACCGHPRPGECITEAARRRLREELGIDCALQPHARHRYRADLGGGMHENEIVHVFTGAYAGPLAADPAEIEDVAWVDSATVRDAIARAPHSYTVWFAQYVHRPWFAAVAGTAR